MESCREIFSSTARKARPSQRFLWHAPPMRGELRAYIDRGLTGIVARFVADDAHAQMRLMLEELRPRLSL
jgi:hypothetical protein